VMFVTNRHLVLAGLALLACLGAGAYARQGGAVLALAYDSQTRGPVPIPPSERGLQTVIAEPWFKVSEEPRVLEGPCFDRNGHLVFSDVYGGHVLRLTPDKQLSTFLVRKSSAQEGSRSTKTGASSLPQWAISRELVPLSR